MVRSAVACAVALALVASASVLRALDISQCIAPLGMESGLIPDKDISASSCYNDGNVAPQNGRLNQDILGGAWCPRSQITTESAEWLEVELRGVHVVTGVGTQGRFGNGQGQEYAEGYLLEYWRPRLGKWVRYRTLHGQEVLAGNTNTYLEQKNRLSPPIWASKVRFIPYSSHRRTVCMRVEIYGCLWNVGIVSYSMPQGDRRSNGVELEDVTYDGVWGAGASGELRSGLGQLVDGVWGGDEIREAATRSAFVGWRNDSRPNPPAITFEFEQVREFTAVHIYCNNKFMRDVQVFSMAVVTFSIGGRQFQEEPVRFSHAEDHIFESSRNVTIPLHHRIGRFVRLELHFAARWILISEVVFDSDVAQGNHTAESARPARGGGGGGGAGVAGGTLGGTSTGVSTVRREDPVYVAIVVGVVTALVILVGGAVFLLVHRHRHRKCFASPLTLTKSSTPPAPALATASLSHRAPLDKFSSCGMSTLPDCKGSVERCGDMGLGLGGLEMKSEEYQEPYQALVCAPYFSYSTVLLEPARDDDHNAASDSSNYEYAVPELSCAPLLAERRGRLDSLSERTTHVMGSSLPPSPSPSPPPSPPLPPSPSPSPLEPPPSPPLYRPGVSVGFGSLSSRHSWSMERRAVSALRQRLETSSVAEFPRHRLRMISKLAEGAFGTVYVAEAEGVPEYEGGVCAEKRLVAVKFLTQDADSHEMSFERDVRILAGLAHPCLARVLGACRAPPRAVVLEYLCWGELAAHLRRPPPAHPPPPPRALLHVAAQLAAGMHYLETLNFVHRDLAARNCLIGPGYTIKISDFGTDNEAYAADYYKVAGGGTVPLRWAAWEAVLSGRHSTRADVWAFGVTLYEVFSLCRRRPYERMSDEEVLANLAEARAGLGGFEPLPRPPLCPRALYGLMAQCWRRDELRRPSFRRAHAFLQDNPHLHS